VSRKVLYSPGFGAGWTTWGGDTAESKRFMLEYPPFVAYLEAGGDPAKLEPKSHAAKEEDMHPLTQRFLAEFRERFPTESAPYLGGLDGLTVETVPDGARVRIEEYDGSESLVIEGEDEGWL
jgi:hypothetical protein